MSIRWIDVSITLHGNTTVWPGDPAFRLEPHSRIASGGSSNVSVVTLSTHTGTHIDAPWHNEEDGKHLHEIDASVFFGEALLVDMSDVDVITADDLAGMAVFPRMLFKTRNSGLPEDAPFRTDFVALDSDAAQYLVEGGVRLVGVDYLSVAPYKEPGHETHHRLLRNDVLIVEGLRLGGLPAGLCRFTVLPLPLRDADGSPCRAFVGLET